MAVLASADRLADVNVGAVFMFLVGSLIAWRGVHGLQQPIPGMDGMKECPACLKRIPMAARRCSYCTEELRGTK